MQMPIAAGKTVFVLRHVDPPSWSCLHGTTATFWPNVTVTMLSDCTYTVGSKDGIVAPYPTSTAAVAYRNATGSWVPWRSHSYDVSFSVGSADGYCTGDDEQPQVP
jgi:hypothetical protein